MRPHGPELASGPAGSELGSATRRGWSAATPAAFALARSSGGGDARVSAAIPVVVLAGRPLPLAQRSTGSEEPLGCSPEPGAPVGSARRPVGAAAPVGAVVDRSADFAVTRPVSAPAQKMYPSRLPGSALRARARPVRRCLARCRQRFPSPGEDLGFAPDRGRRCSQERPRSTARPLLHGCVDPTALLWPSPNAANPPRRESLMHFRDAPSGSPGQVQRRCGKIL
jgi:hypothetical protein